MITHSIKETMEYASSLAASWTKYITLSGMLWAWKTHFVKWFAQGLGIESHSVKSPTYTYMHIYENKLLHIDMYRLEVFEDAQKKWIIDQIFDAEYCIIERPKRTHTYTTANRKHLMIKKVDDHSREFIDIETQDIDAQVL